MNYLKSQSESSVTMLVTMLFTTAHTLYFEAYFENCKCARNPPLTHTHTDTHTHTQSNRAVISARALSIVTICLLEKNCAEQRGRHTPTDILKLLHVNKQRDKHMHKQKLPLTPTG